MLVLLGLIMRRKNPSEDQMQMLVIALITVAMLTRVLVMAFLQWLRIQQFMAAVKAAK